MVQHSSANASSNDENVVEETKASIDLTSLNTTKTTSDNGTLSLDQKALACSCIDKLLREMLAFRVPVAVITGILDEHSELLSGF